MPPPSCSVAEAYGMERSAPLRIVIKGTRLALEAFSTSRRNPSRSRRHDTLRKLKIRNFVPGKVKSLWNMPAISIEGEYSRQDEFCVQSWIVISLSSKITIGVHAFEDFKASKRRRRGEECTIVPHQKARATFPQDYHSYMLPFHDAKFAHILLIIFWRQSALTPIVV